MKVEKKRALDQRRNKILHGQRAKCTVYALESQCRTIVHFPQSHNNSNFQFQRFSFPPFSSVSHKSLLKSRKCLLPVHRLEEEKLFVFVTSPSIYVVLFLHRNCKPAIELVVHSFSFFAHLFPFAHSSVHLSSFRIGIAGIRCSLECKKWKTFRY